MRKKYTMALLSLAVLLVLLVMCGVGYANFEQEQHDPNHALVYVEGALSFNFLDGNTIHTKEKVMTYQFSITNTSEDPYYYDLTLLDVSGGENAEVELTSSKEGFQSVTRKYTDQEISLSSSIKINGLETHSYTLTLRNPDAKETKGTINILQKKDMANFANVILKNNIINNSSQSVVAQNTAEGEEGLIESTDEFGSCYYFRGSVTNNYVIFAGKTWRIVKINGDGSVKLILDEVIPNSSQFYSKDSSYDLNFLNSKIYSNLNEWYQTNLKDYDNFIANFKYCTDETMETTTRIYTNHNPIFECLGNASTSKIGLLTADEASFAGANNKSANTKFYLYSSNIKGGWWTMSPSKEQNGTYSYIEMFQNGMLSEGTNGNLFRGARPVINLIKRTNVTGSGTPTDPYLVNNL